MNILQRACGFLASLDAQREVFVNVVPDTLMQEAQSAAARQAAGRLLGPLDGQFVAVKANIDVQALPSHAGSLAIAPHPAENDAPIVSRLRSAGAIILGHVNMSEFAFSGLGVNPHFGTPMNALDSTKVPGGSSSGSASAVALGLADIALGTDTSGSVRIPAACQGLVGFRPTMGRYESAGIVPLAPSLDTPGPLASNVSQVCAVDRVLSDHKETGRVCRQILCLNDDALVECSPEIGAMYNQALQKLSDHGIDLERVDLQSFARVTKVFQTYGTLVSAEAFRLVPNLVGDQLSKLDPNVRDRLAQAASIRDSELQEMLALRRTLISNFGRELSGKMLLYPTLPWYPPSVQAVIRDRDVFARENALILSIAMKTAFLDAPTIALPFGERRAGNSLSLSGAANSDPDVLATASFLERVFSEENDG
ncbi:amidase family protein [Shimia sp. CNT1-13L.2]|uniref:amidase family protein n=1 Tax=Shimia sp. CNT1-13L.2 TaxID=2959663 RepID=UPI0020CC0A47|nr:amidase family protein [Shimia sp. CNT1-13L.2]MCP9483462.1 amidase family protein [Shimia sp. CNT1-13L.2]